MNKKLNIGIFANQMADLPIILPSGEILVYGLGVNEAYGMTTNNPNRVFGLIHQIYDGAQTYIYGGDLVIFDKTTATGVLYYGGQPYTQIPARLVTKQIIPP